MFNNFKNFLFSLIILILLYFYVPEIGSFITIIGVTIFICQLAAILSRLIVHSNYSPKLFIPATNRLVLVTGCDSKKFKQLILSFFNFKFLIKFCSELI